MHVARMPQLSKWFRTIMNKSQSPVLIGNIAKQAGVQVMRMRHPRGSKAGAMLGVLCIAIALLWCSAATAETRVYLLRGWFGVFSTGLDSLAEELRSKGIKAETADHLAWRSIFSKVIKDRAAGNIGQ